MSSTLAIEEAQILHSVRDFLELTGRAEAVAVLEKCPGVSPRGLPSHLRNIRELVLRGWWSELLAFLELLAGIGDEAGYAKCRCAIVKQQYLERVATKPPPSILTAAESGQDAENESLSSMLGLLHELEQLCPSRAEYTALLSLLILPSLSSSSEYCNWELYSARLQCFYDIASWMSQVLYPGQEIDGISSSSNPAPTSSSSSVPRLTELLVKGLLYEQCETKCSQRCGTASVGNHHRNDNILDLCAWIEQQPDSAFQLSPSNFNLVVLPHDSSSCTAHKSVPNVGQLVSSSLGAEAAKELTSAVEKPTLVSRSVPQLSGVYVLPSRSADDDENVRSGIETTTTIRHPAKSSKDGESNPTIQPQKPTGKELGTKEANAHLEEIDDNWINIPSIVAPASTTFEAKCGRISSTPKPHSVIPSHPPAFPTSPVPYIPATHASHPHTSHHPHQDTELSSDGGDNTSSSTRKQIDFSSEEMALSNLHWPAPKLISTITDTQVIRSVAFSESGDLVAVGANSKTLQLCSTQPLLDHSNSAAVCEGPPVLYHHPRYHRGSIYCLAWLDDRLLASGSNDQTINLLSYAGPSSPSPYKLQARLSASGTIRDLVFMPPGPRLVSGGSGDHRITISNCNSCQVISSLAGHTEQVSSLAVVDENIVASSSQDRTIKLWDVRQQECVYSFPLVSTAGCIAAHGTSSKLASSHIDGSVTLFDLATMKTVACLKVHTDEARSVRFSPDGKWLLSGSYDSRVCLIDAGLLEEWREMGQHDAKIIQCRWHRGGKLFASTGADMKACFWELQSK